VVSHQTSRILIAFKEKVWQNLRFTLLYTKSARASSEYSYIKAYQSFISHVWKIKNCFKEFSVCWIIAVYWSVTIHWCVGGFQCGVQKPWIEGRVEMCRWVQFLVGVPRLSRINCILSSTWSSVILRTLIVFSPCSIIMYYYKFYRKCIYRVP